MSKVTVNNVELSLNLLDADIMEKYEAELIRVQNEAKDPAQYDGMTTPQAMRKQCRMIEGFFDRLFGEGTANKVFNGSNDLRTHLEAFGAVSQLGSAASAEIREIKGKYTADRLANRSQRRAIEYKNINRSGKQHHYGKKNS